MRIISVVTGVVIVIVMVSVMIGVIGDRSGSTELPEWAYDDYKPVSDYEGLESVDGSLELVTVGSTQYIHCKELGSGTLTYSDGTVQNVNVSKKPLDLLFLFGQSNATYIGGNAVPSEASPQCEPGTAYYYGWPQPYTLGYSGLNSPGAERINSFTGSDGVNTLGDKGAVMAAVYHEQTGRACIVASGAIGGRSITTFDPDGDGTTWNYAKGVVSRMLEAIEESEGFTLGIVGPYFWIQGEADVNMDPATYRSLWLQMNDAMLSGGLGLRFTHCYISEVRGAMGPVQVQIAEDYPDIVTISTDAALGFSLENGLMADQSHYTQAGNNIIGAAFGTSAAEYYEQHPVQESESSVDRLLSIVPVMILAALLAAIGIYLASRYWS